MIANLQAHITRLCHEHSIACWTDCKRPSRARAARELEEIHIAPVRSRLSYATALHEIGHVLGRHQTSRRSMVREVHAWQWARRHALVWTPAMERYAAEALRFAARRTAR
jgi:hypothetical protein